MAVLHRRTAVFDAVLVYMDEPQVVTLVSQKTRIVAVAIPYGNETMSMFLATSASDRDWNRYLDGTVDLRYLFTVPSVRTLYHFDLQSMKEKKVKMTPWEGDLDERYLPLPRFFSSNHTEDYAAGERASDPEKLLIDGEWELTDFGQFQQKFSDIYAFLAATRNWQDANAPLTTRRKIKEAFLNRPFQGGFSYVHLFRELGENVPRADQLNLNKIQYASPGHVEIFGKEEIFGDLQLIIPNFLQKRQSLSVMYNDFHRYLSANHYLKMSGDEYGINDPTEGYINQTAGSLAKAMMAPDFSVVSALANKNALVSAKIVLSFYRRLSDAAMYFAQGRIAYED